MTEAEAVNATQEKTHWELTTGRLRLRRLQPGDGEAMYGYRSDPRVRCYQQTPASASAAEEFVVEQQTEAFDTPGTWSQIGVELTESGELIGDLVKSFWTGDHWGDEVLCALLRSEWQ